MSKNKKVKLPAWVVENVPDDAEWEECCITVTKDETQHGSKINITQKVEGTRIFSITGKEVKDEMNFNSSPFMGVVFMIAGAVIGILYHLITKEFVYVFPGILIIGGLIWIIRSIRISSKAKQIDSWEALEPFAEKYLIKKAVDTMRKEYEGKSSFIGFYCIPVRCATTKESIQEFHNKHNMGFGLLEETKIAIITIALTSPLKDRVLIRTK